MATNTKVLPPPPPPPSNGVITGPPKGIAGGNRKKQKRRAKQAAKAAQSAPSGGHPGEHHPDVDYDEDPLGYGEEDYEYSDAEPEHYQDQYVPSHPGVNGYNPPPPPGVKKRAKKQGNHNHEHVAYNPSMLPPLPHPPAIPAGQMRPVHKGGHHVGNIWNTSTQQERQNIKDFWLSLSEEERKSLLKIEKEAVLRKMKQQQKHSCSCTVCGRKRTAIEEELEVLYEGYYEELEQYAHHDQPPLPSTDGMIPDPLQHRRPPHPLAAPPPNPRHKTSNLHEHLDDDEYSDEEEYSDEDDEYSDEDPEPPRGVPDFFNFGQNLTVKDNLLTVADDLLKNDGRKFIEMMEQLAERRMQRESEAEYAAANPSHPGAYPSSDPAYHGEDPLAAGDEFDDDEGSYDSQEEYDDDMEEEDEMGGLTEEQRMQEGRRMFQIFAARMFEQRVLTAYREKVAAERQQKLLEELEDETKLEAQREAKKQRDAQKKKDKKKQQQQAKAEEKARKDAEKAAEEARLREVEEMKLDEQRRKKEEMRKKREEQKRKEAEDQAKRDADKARREQEIKQAKEESERKSREQKAAEKAKKEEARKERELREKEARDRKAQEDKEKKDREVKVRAEKEVRERERTTQQQPSHSSHATHHAPQLTKRPSQPGMVAVPGLHPKQTPSGISSPHPSIATPAIPKAPTPAKQRQTSQQGSHASSPKQSQSQPSSVPSKSSSPGSVNPPQHPTVAPKTIMQKPGNPQPSLQHPMQTTSPLQPAQIQPPPGMSHPQQHPGGFPGMPPMAFPGFQGGPPGPMMHSNVGQRGPMPMYQHQQGPPLMGMPSRLPYGPGMNGVPAPPPGMMAQQWRGTNFFDGSGHGQPPPGFGQHHLSNQTSPIGQPPQQLPPPGPTGSDASRSNGPAHSRQPSANEKERFEPAVNQPIARPAPIQRPSSAKPHSRERRGSNTDIDDLSKHLGSSALLADDDEPLPVNVGDTRRHSNLVSGPRSNPPGGLGQIGGFGAAPFGTQAPNWNTPNLPFGQNPGLGPQNWNSVPSQGIGGWTPNNSSFAANGAFSGPLGAGPMHRGAGAGLNRPLTIRLAICQACKQLSDVMAGQGDGFHDVDALLRRIEMNRPMLDSPPTLRELEDICETEGDSQNGGGELRVRRSEAGDRFAVRWESEASVPDAVRGGHPGLGEIGSPLPSKTSPAVGFGAPGVGRAGAFANLNSF